MTTAEQIYQDVQELPEPLALQVLHFVEFLKSKNLSVNDLTLERKIQQGIGQAENGLGITLNETYANNLNQRVKQRLAVNQKN